MTLISRNLLPSWWIESSLDVAAETVRGGADLARSAVSLPVRAATSAIQAAGSEIESAAAGSVRRLRSDLATLADLRPERNQRRVAAGPDRAAVEVRGLASEHSARVRRALHTRLDSLEGVRRWQINAVTGRLAAELADPRADLQRLLDAVAAAEDEAEVSDRAWDRSVEHPSDREPVLAAAISLTADLLAVGVAAAGPLLPLRGPLRFVRRAALLADNQPRLRGRLEDLFGRTRTDVVLTLATAIGGAAAENVATLVLDSAQRGLSLAETHGAYTRWGQWEAELSRHAHGSVEDPLQPRTRPVPMPGGPIERVADETAGGSLVGAAALAVGGRVGAAFDAVELGAPKAARASREAYAATVSALLAREGVLTLHPRAWRRLDRLSALIITGETLLSDRHVVLDAEPANPDEPAAELWAAAREAIHAQNSAEPIDSRRRNTNHVQRGDTHHDRTHDTNQPRDTDHVRQVGTNHDQPHDTNHDQQRDTDHVQQRDTDHVQQRDTDHVQRHDTNHNQQRDTDRVRLVGPGEDTVPLTRRPVWREVRRGERVLGRVLIGREPDPRAQAVLARARAAGVRVILSGDRDLHELRSLVDEFVPAQRSRSELVDRLQREGHVVGVLGSRSFKALDWADVAIGVVHEADGAATIPWSADAVCRDLSQVQRILDLIGPARQVSERARTLALSASALGGLLLTATPARNGSSSPLVAANVAGLLNGALTGWRAARGTPADPLAPLLPWHALEPGEVLERLPELADRPDERIERESHSGTKIFGPAEPMIEFATHLRSELADPLTPLLGVGALATAILGSPADAVLLSSVLAVNAVVSARQRQRAERALHRMIEREQTTGRVLDRAHLDDPDPAETTVPAEILTVGDIIALHPGAVVPADARLLRVDGLEVDESGLTGESITVDKRTAATPGAILSERSCMVFEGATVVNGDALAVIVATGDDTQAGRATAGAQPPEKGGIQAQLRALTDRALPLTLAGGTIVTLLGGTRGRTLRQAIADGVGVAVAAVPEGLPLVATVAQLAAARRLSRSGVLVRASRTVEALGRVDTLCFDKTGTLTSGQLRLTTLADCHRQWKPDDSGDDAQRLLRAAVRACPDPADGPAHHATDRAVLDAAHAHLGHDAHRWHPIDEIPFDSNRGYAAALGNTARHLRLFVKGAPEVILPRCTRIRDADGTVRDLTPERREDAERAVRGLAEQGLRVLTVARRDLPTAPDDVETTVHELTLLGYVGLADTPRPNSIHLVKALQHNGIGVRIITGDHPVTAAAVARQLGVTAEHVATGADLDRLDESGQLELIDRSAVFARVSPEHKVRIIAALRRRGHTVGMTGDGSNDAAAIRTADVGIGLAARGSLAARNAADLVLTRPDPLLLLDALIEGRGMWQRVTDAVGVLVGGNAGEVGFTLYGTAVGGHAPLGTRQFLLVNMLTDMFPALALALTPGGSGSADDPGDDPRSLAARRSAELAEIPPAHLGPDLVRTLAVRATATTAAASLAWTIGHYTGTPRRAATIGLVALIGTQLGQTLQSARTSPLVWLTTAASGAALAGVVMTPGLCTYFGCRPLGPAGWAIALGSAAAGTLGAARLPALLPQSITSATPGTPSQS